MKLKQGEADNEEEGRQKDQDNGGQEDQAGKEQNKNDNDTNDDTKEQGGKDDSKSSAGETGMLNTYGTIFSFQIYSWKKESIRKNKVDVLNNIRQINMTF